MKKISLVTLEHLVGLAALLLASTGLLIYALQEPGRIVQAQAAQLAADLDDAMTLYAQNCSVCHGLAGEGIGATPALDQAVLRESDPASLTKIIARGLFGTAMPAWHIEDGGPLSDYQIAEMVSLIQRGDWAATQDRVVNLGLAPLVPFTTEPDQAVLDALAVFPEGDELVRGITVYAEQCVACHGADGQGTSLAPALNDPALRAKPVADLERTILNGVPGTLMAGWQNTLSAADTSALLALITRWDTVPSGAIPAPERPVPVTAESLAQGADLYAQSCARCHGQEGQGTQRAPALNVKGFLTDTGDAAIQQIITLGVPGTSMPAWGDRLTDVEIQSIVGYIRTWEATAPEVATPARGGPWWSTSSSRRGGGRSLPSGGQAAPTATPAVDAASSPEPTATMQALTDQGQGQPTAGQEAGQTAVPTQDHQGGGPPWAQDPSQTAEDQQTLDFQALALVGGLALIALVLIIAGLNRLRRLSMTT